MRSKTRGFGVFTFHFIVIFRAPAWPVFCIYGMMTIVATYELNTRQKEAIYSLWNAEYPAQLAYADMSGLEHYLLPQQDAKHYFALGADDEIVGWAFVFTRDEARWFAVIVARRWQGHGVGALLVEALKADEHELNGWVTDHNRYLRTDGQQYISPMAFYKKAGFVEMPEKRLDTGRLQAIAIRWVRRLPIRQSFPKKISH